jgi:N-acetylneuraminate synthase
VQTVFPIPCTAARFHEGKWSAAEIGINHNGEVELAKRMIDIAAFAGCDFVKFQKREPEICVPQAQRTKPKDTPWGEMTYLEYRKRIEFGQREYEEIDRHCGARGIRWFASAWDVPSVDFLSQFVDVVKIPSALITDLDLCRYARRRFGLLMVSTGMSTEAEVCQCVSACDPDVIFHTNSTYPSPERELNLRYLEYLREKYPGKATGYSGHEFGLATTMATVPLGVEYIERHVTLDRTMWGSDQMASVEPQGLLKLVKGVRNIEAALGTKGERILFASELKKREMLRGDSVRKAA